jgi:hypothetical protein
MTFNFVVHLKMTQALGISFPYGRLLPATEVRE